MWLNIKYLILTAILSLYSGFIILNNCDLRSAS
jgi:hypothetical protein